MKRKNLSNDSAIPVASAAVVERADGKGIVIDRSKCFFPSGCPGCSNCDPFVAIREGAP